jgi:hypothetical protein
MRNRHSGLQGAHAFLSASKYHWIGYTDERLAQTWGTHMMAVRGTQLHDFASKAIKLGMRMPRNKKTVNAYVNDAIGFRMSTEVTLFYSENCFGTADAISFHDNYLRIHDLKTGTTPTSVKQLEVYAALFCLEYGHNPFDIGMEGRIYQNDEVQIYELDPDTIHHVMDRIITFDRRIRLWREEAE